MDPEENELGGNDVPLAFRMMEDVPGIAASLGFAQRRATNTLMRGGFKDDRRFGPGKYGGFTRSGELVQPRASAYYGRRGYLNLDDVSPGRAMRLAEKHGVSAVGGRVERRATRLANAAGTANAKMAFGKTSRMNHLTARPRALNRFNSLAMFNASEKTAFYSPFQVMAKIAGSQAIKNEAFRKAVYGADATRDSLKGEQIFARGTISMITAGRKLDLLERKAKFLPDGTAANRAARKVLKAQEQVRRLAKMNNPAALAGINEAISAGQKVGLTGNLMAQAGGTQGTRFISGYARGALGMGTADSLAVKHLGAALGEQGLKRSGTAVAEKALQEGVFKTLGFKRTMQAATTKQGFMALGTRTAAMAIPGLNLLATASLVYDLGKLGGHLVKSGVNLAKDAVKSMKGSIDKPMFGMGYKDNEVAATSRARGVMAIQNSRLNARSMLGSEGSMMAAHFG